MHKISIWVALSLLYLFSSGETERIMIRQVFIFLLIASVFVLYKMLGFVTKLFYRYTALKIAVLKILKKDLTDFGEVRPDGRGKHSNRPNRLSEKTKSKVFSFIKSLKGRKSHYSLKDTSKVYLPDELNKA